MQDFPKNLPEVCLLPDQVIQNLPHYSRSLPKQNDSFDRTKQTLHLLLQKMNKFEMHKKFGLVVNSAIIDKGC